VLQQPLERRLHQLVIIVLRGAAAYCGDLLCLVRGSVVVTI
jgi:hypothetical protein